MTARQLALSVLLRCEKSGSYSNLTLDSALKSNPLKDSDRSLAACLDFGVISRKITLDHYISAFSSIKLSKLESTVLCVLRMGVFQLLFLDRIPDHATVNESVSLAPKRARGFVNAVLRQIIREKNTVELPKDPIERLSVEFSVPTELCRRICNRYGETLAKTVLASFNEVPPLTLRVNTLKTDREALMRLFEENGIKAELGKISPFAIHVNGESPVSLPGFEDRLFFVQDEASQLCCAATGVFSGASFIDCCSAPGSKSFGAAMLMENTGRIVSCDLHANKLSLIRSGASALGIDIIETLEADGRVFRPEFESAFDSVLCDVPCSGFGVIAKKPEIRYKSLSESDRLPEIQLAILENCCRYVKDGGVLVYSTCTILKEENEDIVAQFSERHPEFIPEEFELGVKKYGSSVSLVPGKDTCDGFFIARFRKNTKL